MLHQVLSMDLVLPLVWRPYYHQSGRAGRTSVSYNGSVRFSTATQIPR